MLIFAILVFLIIIFGIVTSWKDNARVRNGMEPKYVLKTYNSDSSKITYWGLGYKVIRYTSISPNEPFKNSIGVKFGNWFMKYESPSRYFGRYDEIRLSIRKAVDWVVSARYPSCINEGIYNNDLNIEAGQHFNSSFLIENGYIKQSELLDVDNKSYCDTFVDIKSLYEDPNDHQNNCSIYYNIYLKCKDYQDKGYISFNNKYMNLIMKKRHKI